MAAPPPIEIKLKKADRVYKEGAVVAGVVCVNSKDAMSHQGITLSMEGNVSLQLSAKSVGMFEAFYNSLKPIQLVNYSLEIRKGGKLPAGKTEIPFEFPLKAKPGTKLYETYHGVFVNIQYILRADMKRSAFSKDLSQTTEFIVEDRTKPEATKEIAFSISPNSLEAVQDRSKIPDFLVEGKLATAVCSITDPFSGSLTVIRSEAAIKSIELQLVRVETCGCLEGYAKDATEIQNIQIGDGDVCRGVEIPVYMIFPRLFTCPTLATDNFKVEFEINIVIVLQTGDLITENFPIKLVRDK
eukprot:m.485003 g.485003  ORF g.485003 m.485003 type:complete len:299 (+) comp23626_c0_seq1:212-1108(+)